MLAPGEPCHSALLLEDGVFVRRDFSADAWPAQDPDLYLSWWRTRVPEAGNERKAFRLNAETLAQIFANLKDSRSRAQQCLAYVVALALVRARKLQFIAVERQQDGRAQLVIGDRAKDLRYRVRDPQMTPAEEQHVLDGLLAVTDPASPIWTVHSPASSQAWLIGSSASIIASPTAPPSVNPYDAERMYPAGLPSRRTTSAWNMTGSGSVTSTCTSRRVSGP